MLRKQNKYIQNQWSDRADSPEMTVEGEARRSRPLYHSSLPDYVIQAGTWTTQAIACFVRL